MCKQLRVAIDVRLIGRQRTGDETVFFNLTRELIRRREQDMVLILLTDRSEAGHIASLRTRLECLGREDVEIVALPSLGNRFLWNALALPQYLFRHPVDILHTQYILPLVLPKRLAVLTHIHDCSFAAHPEWIGWSDRFFLKLFLPRTFTRSDAIIAPSVFTEGEIRRFFSVPPERIHVIPNAAGEEWSENERGGARPRETPYFVAYGTLQPRKNIRFLIEAWQLARQRGDMPSLVIVGDRTGHNTEAALRERAGTDIIFTGYLSFPELRRYVRNAQAVIFPSRYEGFGLPLLEAFAVGTPVVAADIPAFREVAGDAFLAFDPVTLDSAAQALYTCSIDATLRRQLQERGKARLALFSWPASADALVSLYRSLPIVPHD
jgi:glycosyltransferase involved in cell wall biosynthesis